MITLAFTPVQVFALGISSVFSQVLDDMSPDEADQVFSAYINALDEDPKQYKKDAEKLTELGKACDGPGDLKPDASGSEVRTHSFECIKVHNGFQICRSIMYLIGSMCNHLHTPEPCNRQQQHILRTKRSCAHLRSHSARHEKERSEAQQRHLSRSNGICRTAKARVAQQRHELSQMQVQKVLAGIKDRAENSKFFYTRFFAIGLFRLLELTSARDPKALETLVSVRRHLLVVYA